MSRQAFEQQLEGDQSLSRKLAERYLGDRRNPGATPPPGHPQRRQTDNRDQGPAIEA